MSSSGCSGCATPRTSAGPRWTTPARSGRPGRTRRWRLSPPPTPPGPVAWPASTPTGPRCSSAYIVIMKVRATTPKAVTITPVEQTARSVAREEHLEAADRGGVGGGVEAVERLGLAAPQEQQAGGPVPFDDRRARRR